MSTSEWSEWICQYLFSYVCVHLLRPSVPIFPLSWSWTLALAALDRLLQQPQALTESSRLHLSAFFGALWIWRKSWKWLWHGLRGAPFQDKSVYICMAIRLYTVCLSLSLPFIGWHHMPPTTAGVYLQNTHNIRNHVASIWNADILFLELNPVQHRVWEFLSMLDTLSCLRPFLRNKDTLEPMSSSQNPRHFYLLSLLIRFSYWYRNELYKSSH